MFRTSVQETRESSPKDCYCIGQLRSPRCDDAVAVRNSRKAVAEIFVESSVISCPVGIPIFLRKRPVLLTHGRYKGYLPTDTILQSGD